EISMKAWESIQEGEVNPMEDLLESNPEINKYLSPAEIDKLLNAKNHVGNAPQKALELANRIKKI
ncbi:MAG: adenylosuccinate lyase, partial [Candidatus Daviesbacteria bacterium]|nr:adenylosuccinate lyase [Candidatus Daviesbacteria bacterium]